MLVNRYQGSFFQSYHQTLQGEGVISMHARRILSRHREPRRGGY